MAVIHHEGCTLDANHDATEQCVRILALDRDGAVLGYPGEHSRGCTLGDHTLSVPCGEAVIRPPAQRPLIQTSRLDVDIPMNIPPIPDTAFAQAGRRPSADIPLVVPGDPYRAKVRGPGGLNVDISGDDGGLFSRVLSAIGDAIGFALDSDG